MKTSKQWYAVYTRSRWEKKIAEILTKKGITNYCPLNKKMRQWADRKKAIYEPLFPNYVFVEIEERESVPVRQTRGVLNFVHWLGKPATIKENEIEAIKNFISSHSNIKLERTMVNKNDNVRIIGGPLNLLEGEIMEVNRKTVKISLPSLGYSLLAEIDKSNIQLINISILPVNVKAS